MMSQEEVYVRSSQVILLTFYFAVIVLCIIFWLWMLFNCVGRKMEAFDTKIVPDPWNKLVWLIIVVLLNLLGAILYWWFIYREPPGLSLERRRRLEEELDRRRKGQADALGDADQRDK